MTGQLSTLAFCWRLERRDGAGLALTTHDQALTVDGVRYEASPGMTPAAIRSDLGLEPKSSEVGGSLSSAAITQGDLDVGRWDGALVKLISVDWETPSQPETLLQGELGEISAKDGSFEGELKGVASQLERPICPLTSPSCRAELGDRACRVDMSGRTMRARVVSVSQHVVTVDQVMDDRFRFGRLRFLAGPANGKKMTILGVTEHELHLRRAPPAVVTAGTPIELTEGCDKLLATCAARFNNAVNFRGEPHLPGNDLITRYPGA